MDETLRQRRIFHSSMVRIPQEHCFTYVVIPNGLQSHFKKVKWGTNMVGFLYWLTLKMSSKTAQGTTSSKKDIAETFWASQSFIAKQIGLPPSRVSDFFKTLTEGGVLVRGTGKISDRYFAFSKEAIDAWVRYSKELSRQEDGAETLENAENSAETTDTVSVSKAGVTDTLAVTDVLRSPYLADTLTVSRSNIEDKTQLPNQLGWDGKSKNEPIPPPLVVSLDVRFKDVFRRRGGKVYIPDELTVPFIEKFVAEKGVEEFVELIEWLNRSYPEGIIWKDTILPKVRAAFDDYKNPPPEPPREETRWNTPTPEEIARFQAEIAAELGEF